MQRKLCYIVVYSGGMNVGQPRIQGHTVGLVIYWGFVRQRYCPTGKIESSERINKSSAGSEEAEAA